MYIFHSFRSWDVQKENYSGYFRSQAEIGSRVLMVWEREKDRESVCGGEMCLTVVQSQINEINQSLWIRLNTNHTLVERKNAKSHTHPSVIILNHWHLTWITLIILLQWHLSKDCDALPGQKRVPFQQGQYFLCCIKKRKQKRRF